MKNFVSIQDVELNELKKKELEEANGGFVFDPGVVIGPCGWVCPDPFEKKGPLDILKPISF
jgi:hypothetical protein